jgi:hypothetical protein
VEHPYTLTGMANLADTYRNQGRSNEAEELEIQVMEMRKRVLSIERPDTLATVVDQVSILADQDNADAIDESNDASYIDINYFLPDAPSVDIVITTRMHEPGRWRS